MCVLEDLVLGLIESMGRVLSDSVLGRLHPWVGSKFTRFAHLSATIFPFIICSFVVILDVALLLLLNLCSIP